MKSLWIVIFFSLSALTYTRGHKYKLYKKQSIINAYKYFFSNPICDIWNAQPNFVFDVSSSNNFRRLLDKVDLSQFTVLLWFVIVIILLSICKSLHALYVQWLCSCSMFIFIKRCLLACLALGQIARQYGRYHRYFRDSRALLIMYKATFGLY